MEDRQLRFKRDEFKYGLNDVRMKAVDGHINGQYESEADYETESESS